VREIPLPVLLLSGAHQHQSILSPASLRAKRSNLVKRPRIRIGLCLRVQESVREIDLSVVPCTTWIIVQLMVMEIPR